MKARGYWMSCIYCQWFLRSRISTHSETYLCLLCCTSGPSTVQSASFRWQRSLYQHMDDWLYLIVYVYSPLFQGFHVSIFSAKAEPTCWAKQKSHPAQRVKGSQLRKRIRKFKGEISGWSKINHKLYATIIRSLSLPIIANCFSYTPTVSPPTYLVPS